MINGHLVWAPLKTSPAVAGLPHNTNFEAKVGITNKNFSEGNLMCLSNSAEELRASAFHETGHVIAHEMFGWRYRNVLIKDNGGWVDYDYEEPTQKSRLVDQLIHAYICLIGKVAENEYRLLASTSEPGTPIWMHGADIDGEISDWDKYQSLHLSNQYLPLLQEFARSIVIEHWSLVSKIATTLFEKKELTFEEIKPMLDGYDLTEKRQSYIQELEAISEKVESQVKQSRDDSGSKDLIIEGVKYPEDFC